MDTAPYQPVQPAGVHPMQVPPQPASGQMVAQQYVVTINGDVNGLPPAFNLKAIGITAILQLVCTVLSVILGVLAIIVGCVDSFDGLPIWMGICFFMVAGILGRVAVRKRNNCSLVAYMVLSIISAIGAGIMTMSTVPAMLFEVHGFYYYPMVINAPQGVRIAVEALSILVALAEMIVAIVASAFCCKGTCCLPPNPLQVQYSPAVPAGSVVMPQGAGQPMMVSQGQSPPSYEAGPLPEKTPMMMPQQAVPVTYVINAAPPVNQPTGQTPPQPNGQSAPAAGNQAVSPDSVGHDIALDDGTDEQPLVM